jgi:hypothetical protein
MQTSWRSWFWNIVMMAIMGFMGLLAVPVAVTESHPAVAVGFGLMAALLMAGAVRALMLGVAARPAGIVVRSFWRSRTIPWGEVERITDGGVSPGMSGAVGATCPVVVRRAPDGGTSTVELEPLGGYGVGRQRPTLAEQAVAGLNQHLDRWRQQHP